MARIDYAIPPHTNAETGAATLNLVRMMAHYPCKDAWLAVGGHLIQRGLLDPVLREIAILRTGRLSDCDYEVVQHRSFGIAIGMSEAKISAAERGDASMLDERERLVLAMTEELHRDGALAPATFARAQAAMPVAEIIEVILVVAFYRGTATFLRSFDVDADADGAAGAKAAIRP